MTNLNFNDAGTQRTIEVIPANTIVTVHLTIRPGGAGDGGWLRRSADGASEGLDCELTVVDGTYAKRKFWQLFTLSGTKENHAQAGEISRGTLRAILESAHGIRPDDESDKAKTARHLSGWQELDGLRFVVRLGVRPPKDNYPAKNFLQEVITPERQGWKQPAQLDVAAKTNGLAPAASATPPANAIARPNWAKKKDE
jgi:hypothetical protein